MATNNLQFASQAQANNQQGYSLNGENPNPSIVVSNQNPNNYYPENPNPNPAIPISRPNQFYGQQQPHYQVQPQQFPNNPANNRRNMLLNQMMNKKTRGSGQSAVIILALISMLFGGLFVTELLNKENQDNLKKANLVYTLSTLYEIKQEDLFFSLIIRSKDDKCLYYLAGILSLPTLTLVFTGFNFCAMIFGFVGLHCMQYIQGIWTGIWGILAITEMSSGCDVVSAFILQFGNHHPLPSGPFYGIMAIFSLVSVIANNKWSSSIANARKDRDRLALMASMVY